jgi:hypothetical protein
MTAAISSPGRPHFLVGSDGGFGLIVAGGVGAGASAAAKTAPNCRRRA